MYTKHNFIDANDSMKELLNKIKVDFAYDIEGAESYAKANKDILGDPISSGLINEIESELVSMESSIFEKTKTVYYSSTEPTFIKTDNVWIGD